MDLSALKSEIKRWEHNFKSRHGRDPTVQDIKDRPDIGTWSPFTTPLHPLSADAYLPRSGKV